MEAIWESKWVLRGAKDREDIDCWVLRVLEAMQWSFRLVNVEERR